MDLRECELTYKKLVVVLDELKLGWLVEQVNAGINAGHIELPQKKGSPTITEDFSAQTRLKYLIDAIEQAVINTFEMEQEVAIFFEHRVAFFPDAEDSQALLLINGDAYLPHERRSEAINYLKELLNTLKSRIVENGSK